MRGNETARPLGLALALVVAALLGAACGGDDDTASGGTTTTAPEDGGGDAAAVLGPVDEASGDPVRVGFVTDGANATTDQSIDLDVAAATVEYLNKHKAGIGGRPIELVGARRSSTRPGAPTAPSRWSSSARHPGLCDRRGRHGRPAHAHRGRPA